MNIKKELQQKIEMYHFLSILCDVALMVLVGLMGMLVVSAEEGDITWQVIAIFAGLCACGAIILLVKRVAWTQQKVAAARLARREAWEQTRDIQCSTPLEELRSDFRRYFGGKIPETSRTGRMLDHVKLEGEQSVDRAVKHWLFMSQYPHIGLWFYEKGEWKLADGEELNGEVIVFERVAGGAA